jgi:dTDP-4-dehydrorhamnose reductase
VRLLLTGGSGLLGAAILDSWGERWETTVIVGRYGIDKAGVENVPGDMAAPGTLASIVERARPHVVLHCAAWTDLDACERDPARARTIHRDASAALALGAARSGAAFVYVSTDSVFAGPGGRHTEDDPAEPRSVYARTKREGEEASLAVCPDTLVVRTCIVGWNAQPKASLAEWILRELRAGRPVKAFRDVSFTPILTTTLAASIERLVLRDAKVRGVLHVSGAECVTKLAFALKVAEVFELPTVLVEPSSVGDARLGAPRPTCPCLDSSRYAALTGERLETVEQGLREMRRLERSGYVDRVRASLRG